MLPIKRASLLAMMSQNRVGSGRAVRRRRDRDRAGMRNTGTVDATTLKAVVATLANGRLQ
ncbi:MAG TPA: hypothetical protein VHN11_18970 [Xanthobacteraceae bacterium]|nr:hypothetical protein [Xanthobacteraceae bacterium]